MGNEGGDIASKEEATGTQDRRPPSLEGCKISCRSGACLIMCNFEETLHAVSALSPVITITCADSASHCLFCGSSSGSFCAGPIQNGTNRSA